MYSNEINWWVEQERSKNGHKVKILPGEIIQELLDISNELRRGYQLKELFLDIVYHAPFEDAKRQLSEFIELCKESKIEEFIEAANTIDNWLEYIVNSFIDERYTNGFTEGTNNKIKVMKRVAFGYRSFKLLRKRILYVFNQKLSGGKSNGRNSNKKIEKK